MKRALISVSDKTGIVEFARGLEALGIDILSTGGTLRLLQKEGIRARSVEEVTAFPEMMDGRVKTLHPCIHGGILAIRDNKEHIKAMETHGISPIDLVVVNLYPFKETIAKEGCTLESAIEQIDIGGPSMVRSAAKNHAYTTVVINPKQYDAVLKEVQLYGDTTLDFRRELALEAFRHTAMYDGMIASYLETTLHGESLPEHLQLSYEKVADLRYGENPHQKAAFYKRASEHTGFGALQQWHGKELSYNNYVDMQAAWDIVWEYKAPAVSIVKHTNPCGVAMGDSIEEAYNRAFAADSVSAFGGIVAMNRECNLLVAEAMQEVFIEVVMAPSFSEEALAALQKKKNIRLITLEVPKMEEWEMQSLSGGLLVQAKDVVENAEYQVVTDRTPTEEEWRKLQFAWHVVKHVKSNAIVIASENATLGIGAGQMNRVGAANIALLQAGAHAKGAVMASDAFFPFADTVQEAIRHGITAIIQPGGSIRDEESIAAANEAGIAMVFTGVRHFKH